MKDGGECLKKHTEKTKIRQTAEEFIAGKVCIGFNKPVDGAKIGGGTYGVNWEAYTSLTVEFVSFIASR